MPAAWLKADGIRDELRVQFEEERKRMSNKQHKPK
jgi:hypothetical protein